MDEDAKRGRLRCLERWRLNLLRRRRAVMDLIKVPIVNGTVIAATTFMDGVIDVLQVLLLVATLFWTVVKIAQALKDFHGEE